MIEGQYFTVTGSTDYPVCDCCGKTNLTRAVASLRKQQKHVLATAQAEATRIEGQIQSLLAIEHVG